MAPPMSAPANLPPLPMGLATAPNVPAVPLGTGFAPVIRTSPRARDQANRDSATRSRPCAQLQRCSADAAAIGFGIPPTQNSLDVHPAGNNGRARFTDQVRSTCPSAFSRS